MRLEKIASGIDPAVWERFADLEIAGLWDDSRRVTPGSLFVLLPGGHARAGDFIGQAVEKGARVVLVPEGILPEGEKMFPSVCFLRVKDVRRAFLLMAGNFFGRPSESVRMIGVTGTNGKTTITYLLESVLGAAGYTAGVVGTVNCRVGGRVMPTRNTTPGLLDNQLFISELKKQGVTHGVMEVSSHALHQGRVDLIDFRGAVFSNLTGDHLDYHGNMEDYFEAKSRLFTGLDRKAYAVINRDDPYGLRLNGMTPARILSYSVKDEKADVRAVIGSASLAGTRLCIRFFGEEIILQTPLIGLHNVYNILAAFSAGLGEGIAPEKIKEGIEALSCVPGRLERVDAGQDFFVFIDYAHTDDGLQNVLSSLKAVKHNRIIVVFGCGGDRDKSKRPRMGRVACELADHAVLTADNSRSEEPLEIIEEIKTGFFKETYEIVPDREEAIRKALSMAQKDDIVLLAGKGHETCQIFRDRTIDFVEKDIAVDILKGMLKREL